MAQHLTTSERKADPQGLNTPARPTLHLSGEKLRAALELVIRASEPIGGVERFIAALKLKSQVFQERLADGRARSLDLATFDDIVPLMATVRRRIGATIAERGWDNVQAAIAALLADAHVPGTADTRMAAFCDALSNVSSPPPSWGRDRVGGTDDPIHNDTPTPNPSSQGGRGHKVESAECFPTVAVVQRGAALITPSRASPSRPQRSSDRPRFLRDLAAEILHNVLPEHYPLMTRWVWDAKANTGVLREIWHDPVAADATDNILIGVPDTHETFLVLREELSQFLSDNGIFRDMPWYVDLLQAQVYSGYINAQGGAWLKTDFGAESDPIEHTRRILGVDARVARSAVDVSGQSSVVSGGDELLPGVAKPTTRTTHD